MSVAFDGGWSTSAPAVVPSSGGRRQQGDQSPPIQFEPPPAPVLNGGLYSGRPFSAGSPWGNVPVTPDAGYMTSVNLLSADPPPGATTQFASTSFRPGNNTPVTIPDGVLSTVDHMCDTLCVNPIVPRPRPRPRRHPSPSSPSSPRSSEDGRQGRQPPAGCPADSGLYNEFAIWEPPRGGRAYD